MTDIFFNVYQARKTSLRLSVIGNNPFVLLPSAAQNTDTAKFYPASSEAPADFPPE
jgi:hypothetical protein